MDKLRINGIVGMRLRGGVVVEIAELEMASAARRTPLTPCIGCLSVSPARTSRLGVWVSQRGTALLMRPRTWRSDQSVCFHLACAVKTRFELQLNQDGARILILMSRECTAVNRSRLKRLILVSCPSSPPFCFPPKATTTLATLSTVGADYCCCIGVRLSPL